MAQNRKEDNMKIIMDEAFNVSVIANDMVIGGGGTVSIGGGGGYMGGGFIGGDDGTAGTGDTSGSGGGMDGLLANWGFVGGITAATLALSIILGILLAKKRIKKGIDPYEN